MNDKIDGNSVIQVLTCNCSRPLEKKFAFSKTTTTPEFNFGPIHPSQDEGWEEL
jgi:hypothetical protein